jgi:hypothetical protein
MQEKPNFSGSSKEELSRVCTVNFEPTSGFFKIFKNFGRRIFNSTNCRVLKSIFLDFSNKHLHLRCQLLTEGKSI